MPRKPKTKYTLRSDGYIVMSQVINDKRKYFYGHSDAECEKKRDEYIAALNSAALEQLKLKHYANIYWERKEPTLSPNSLGNYRKALERVEAVFDDTKVTELTPQEIYSMLNRLAAKDYSARVVGICRTVISQICDLALIDGVINRNPVIDVPRIKTKAATPRQAASDDDIKLIEAHKHDSLMAAMHYFLLYTGCRRGEAVALQQKHIDRKEHVAHIVQSVAYGKARATIKDPKSVSGIRDVHLLDNVLDILPEYDDPETFVFFPDGLPTQKNLEAGMKAYQQSIGLNCTAHQLRHSYASMLHSAGVDVKDAQVLLGHSDISITQNIYTHLEQSHKKALFDDLNKYVKENRLK